MGNLGPDVQFDIFVDLESSRGVRNRGVKKKENGEMSEGIVSGRCVTSVSLFLFFSDFHFPGFLVSAFLVLIVSRGE